MLLRFEASNHRSILEPVELSMIAVDEERRAARSFERLPEKVLTVAGIYGPNASGKSNVLEALAWLSLAAERSLRSWDTAIPRDPFKFGDAPGRPSTFEVELMAAGIRYAYRLEVTDAEVLAESLVSYPKRQPRTLFERAGMDISFHRGLEHRSGTRALLTPTTLALSAIMRFGEPAVQPFGHALKSITGLGLRDLPSPRTDSTFQDGLGTPREIRDSALALLRFADLGIDDVQVAREEERHRLSLLHRVGGQEIFFDFDDEPAGTRAWFRLVGPTLLALRSGRVLLFDQIDASLHPRLCVRLLELFQDPVANPRGAQLVFTTHDTSLLSSLNRDEVWLTKKDPSGAITLAALAEFGGDKVRRSLNLERAYLRGRFGAVPELDQIGLWGDLHVLTRPHSRP